jgi:ubiquinone biosynthesis protein
MKLSNLYRILVIQRVLIRHGFDDIIFSIPILMPFRLVRYFLPWNWLGNQKNNRAKRIRLVFEELGPIFIKFGQILSTRRDLFSRDIADELQKLQDHVPPFPGQEAVDIVEKAYGQPVDQLFLEFDVNPLASASIAQVHPAKLLDGSDVVVKIVRPNLKKAIDQDIALMHKLAVFAEKYWSNGKRLKLRLVVAEFEKTILDELDMMREASNAAQIRRNHQGSKVLYVPKVYWDLTKPNILVIERVHGLNITHRDELLESGADLKLLAEQGIEMFFSQVFRDNFFHADVHPGNLFVVPKDEHGDWRYALVDFGIMGALSDFDQRYLAENFSAFLSRDYRRVARLHVESGWVPEATRVEEFEFAIRSVCEPIFDRALKDVSVGDLLLRLFQTAQRFDMEVLPQLLLLQKTLMNIEGMGRELYPDLDLWATAKPSLEAFMKERVGFESINRNMKENTPRWAVQLPTLPMAMLDLLDQMRTGRMRIKTSDPQLSSIRKEIKVLRRTITLVIVGVGFLISAAVLYGLHTSSFPSSSPVTIETIILGSTGLSALMYAIFGKKN